MSEPWRDRRGTSLVEVVIAILLVAIVCAGLFSTALTGRMSVGRAQRRIDGAAAMRRVAESLKSYVTADPALAAGPGAGPDGWFLPGDASGLRALDAGHHALDAATWAPDLAAAGGALSYDVVLRATPSGPQPTVTVNVAWNEP